MGLIGTAGLPPDWAMPNGPLQGRVPDLHGLRSEDGGAAAGPFAFDLLRLNG